METLEQRKAEPKKILAQDVFSQEFEDSFRTGFRAGVAGSDKNVNTGEYLRGWIREAIEQTRRN